MFVFTYGHPIRNLEEELSIPTFFTVFVHFAIHLLLRSGLLYFWVTSSNCYFPSLMCRGVVTLVSLNMVATVAAVQEKYMKDDESLDVHDNNDWYPSVIFFVSSF